MSAHSNRRRLAALAATLTVSLPAGGLLPADAGAAALLDPVPGLGEVWPVCGTAPDTDGRYCVVSQTKNGIAIVHPDVGRYQRPLIDLIGAGDVRFGVVNYEDGVPATVDNGAGGLMEDGDVSPGDVYRVTVNTGAIVPRELFGHLRNVTYSTGGGAKAGYSFTMTFQAAPAAWVDPQVLPCSIGTCGDDSTRADPYWSYDGFVTGYVTDLADWPARERALRTGFVHVYNAQDASQRYDFATNSLVIELANPHLTTTGAVARGSYQTFLPYPMLTGLMGVPDPASLTGGSFTVTRSVGGASTSAPFTLTHRHGGVAIDIADITFSSPSYRIRPRRAAPGAPRLRAVSRVTRTSVRLRFLAPVADGGAPVTAYRARCRVPGRAWTRASRARSPIVIRSLPRRKVTCSVRAVNRVGAGRWSVPRTG